MIVTRRPKYACRACAGKVTPAPALWKLLQLQCRLVSHSHEDMIDRRSNASQYDVAGRASDRCSFRSLKCGNRLARKWRRVDCCPLRDVLKEVRRLRSDGTKVIGHRDRNPVTPGSSSGCDVDLIGSRVLYPDNAVRGEKAFQEVDIS